MGRSRGGLTTKIHALVDAEGLPITLKITEGKPLTAKAPKACSMISLPVRSCSPTAAMIAMLRET